MSGRHFFKQGEYVIGVFLWFCPNNKELTKLTKNPSAYVKEWERFSKKQPDQIINIYYEDLKEDPVREIKKINTFLGTDRSDDMITKLADACNFENLKKADSEVKVQEQLTEADDRPSPMYRKGQVGDWKNYFTVTQNEKVDEWLENNFVDTDLNFRHFL